jgi:hypothetical protein
MDAPDFEMIFMLQIWPTTHGDGPVNCDTAKEIRGKPEPFSGLSLGRLGLPG